MRTNSCVRTEAERACSVKKDISPKQVKGWSVLRTIVSRILILLFKLLKFILFTLKLLMVL